MLNPFRPVILRTVVANLDDGSAIHGVLTRQNGPLLYFANATVLRPGQQGVPLDGDTIVERRRVLFLQAP